MSWQDIAVGVCVGMLAQGFIRHHVVIMTRVVARKVVLASPTLQGWIARDNELDARVKPILTRTEP